MHVNGSDALVERTEVPMHVTNVYIERFKLEGTFGDGGFSVHTPLLVALSCYDT